LSGLPPAHVVASASAAALNRVDRLDHVVFGSRPASSRVLDRAPATATYHTFAEIFASVRWSNG